MPPAPLVPPPPNEPVEPLRPRGLILVAVACSLIILAASAYIGWQTGQTRRARVAEAEVDAQITRQVDLARADLDAQRPDLAAARLDWVLTRTPDDNATLTLRRQAQTMLAQAVPSPSSNRPNPTPFPTRLPPTPEAGLGDPAARLAALQTLSQQERWDDLISRTIAFQLDYPAYERWQTDTLLFQAYGQRGLALTLGDNVELGLAYFDEAEKLGTLPQEALDRRVLSNLYLNGLAFQGIDWKIAVDNYRALCRQSPFFHDSCQLLFEALVPYGDEFAAQQEWCPAVEAYNEATQYRSSEELVTKLRDARIGCAGATATPEPTAAAP